MVLACLVGFFATVAAVNGVMIYAAVSTFGGVETGNAYRAGLAFAQDIADAQQQDARRWQVRAELSPDKDGATRVELLVLDASSQPVAGLDAILRLAHPTDRRLDRVLEVREDSPGRFRGATRVENGQRDLVIELLRGQERMFRSKTRIVIR
jgi:nitrogen fixation protein FixH